MAAGCELSAALTLRQGSIAALCLTAALGSVQAKLSLCEPNERVVYSCDVKSSSKVASLCASQTLTEQEGYLQYRFGSPGQIELTYPAHKRNSLQKFRLWRYARPMVDRLTISFDSGAYTYTYSSDYDGDEKPPIDKVEILVSRQGSRKVTTLVCVGKQVADFSFIEGIMPCQDDSWGQCP